MMEIPNTVIDRFADEYERVLNRERLKEEASQALFELLERDNVTQKQLANRLGKSEAWVSKALAGAQNFQLDTLADLFMALGRGVHLYLDDETEEPADVEDRTASVPVIDAFQSRTDGFILARFDDHGDCQRFRPVGGPGAIDSEQIGWGGAA